MRPNILLKSTILAVMMIFLISCSGSSGEKLAQYNFKQGTAELNLNFFPNAPPDKIYPNSHFKIILELDNQAAYDINNGKIKIVGLDERFFKVNPLKKDFETLVGKSLTNPAGDKMFIDFDGQAQDLFENAEEYSTNYFLITEYQSTMDFTDSICLNPKLYQFYDSGCQREEKKSYSGQGAPLAVVELEEIILPAGSGATVEFRILLENMGRGKISKVKLESANLGNLPLEDCQFQDAPLGKETAIFYEDKQEAMLICRTFLSSQNSYTTTMMMKFSYNYELEEQHQLLMVK